MIKIKKLSKQDLIRKEKNKLKKIFEPIYLDGEEKTEKGTIKKVYNNKRNLVENLIERCAFMIVTLKECEVEVIENGVIVEMPQGDYTIDRENPALKSYNTTIKSYQNTIKLLFDLIPDEDKDNLLSDEAKEFMNW